MHKMLSILLVLFSVSSISAQAQSYDRHGANPYSGAPAVSGSSPKLFGGSSDIVDEARRWIGTNPTTRTNLWCARFMNFVLQRRGYSGTGSDMASSFATYGRRVMGPQVGAIAVMSRGKHGGHVGVVSGIAQNGNPIIISGNHNKKVGEGVYSRSRIYAYVRPI